MIMLPLLIGREDKRVPGQKEKVTFTFSIIPEISYLTGLTNEHCADSSDGVGDDQLKSVKEYELARLKQACVSVSEDYKPPFTFVVVQKRVNVRFYVEKGGPGNQVDNPSPGTILEHTITRRGLHDFYLVPQSVRQGTVTPTHCVVVEDENNYPPDVIQRLTYKLCFLYYNWPGTVRVPACCQYAHKLAFLVGQSLAREPAEQLSDRLFYL